MTWDWKKGIIGGLLVTVSLVIHELAHAVVALFFSVQVHGIGIKFKGAYTFRRYASRRLHDVLIAAAGPFSNLVLMYVSFFTPKIGVWLAEWNCGIALMNLLPFPGTDGYRILKTMFWADAALYEKQEPVLSAQKLPDPA